MQRPFFSLRFAAPWQLTSADREKRAETRIISPVCNQKFGRCIHIGFPNFREMDLLEEFSSLIYEIIWSLRNTPADWRYEAVWSMYPMNRNLITLKLQCTYCSQVWTSYSSPVCCYHQFTNSAKLIWTFKPSWSAFNRHDPWHFQIFTLLVSLDPKKEHFVFKIEIIGFCLYNCEP